MMGVTQQMLLLIVTCVIFDPIAGQNPETGTDRFNFPLISDMYIKLFSTFNWGQGGDGRLCNLQDRAAADCGAGPLLWGWMHPQMASSLHLPPTEDVPAGADGSCTAGLQNRLSKANSTTDKNNMFMDTLDDCCLLYKRYSRCMAQHTDIINSTIVCLGVEMFYSYNCDPQTRAVLAKYNTGFCLYSTQPGKSYSQQWNSDCVNLEAEFSQTTSLVLKMLPSIVKKTNVTIPIMVLQFQITTLFSYWSQIEKCYIPEYGQHCGAQVKGYYEGFVNFQEGLLHKEFTSLLQHELPPELNYKFYKSNGDHGPFHFSQNSIDVVRTFAEYQITKWQRFREIVKLVFYKQGGACSGAGISATWGYCLWHAAEPMLQVIGREQLTIDFYTMQFCSVLKELTNCLSASVGDCPFVQEHHLLLSLDTICQATREREQHPKCVWLLDNQALAKCGTIVSSLLNYRLYTTNCLTIQAGKCQPSADFPPYPLQDCVGSLFEDDPPDTVSCPKLSFNIIRSGFQSLFSMFNHTDALAHKGFSEFCSWLNLHT